MIWARTQWIEALSGWNATQCEQCRVFGPVMEENDLCQNCNDQIASQIANKDQPQ